MKTIFILFVSLIFNACYTVFPSKPNPRPEILNIINTPITNFELNENIIIKSKNSEYQKNKIAELSVINQTHNTIRIPYSGGQFIEGLRDSIWEIAYTHYPRMSPNISIIPYSELKSNDSLTIKMTININDDQISIYKKFRFGVTATSDDKYSKYRWGNYSSSFKIKS